LSRLYAGQRRGSQSWSRECCPVPVPSRATGTGQKIPTFGRRGSVRARASRTPYSTGVRPVRRGVRVRLACFRVQRSLLVFRDFANLLMYNEYSISAPLLVYTIQLQLWAKAEPKEPGKSTSLPRGKSVPTIVGFPSRGMTRQPGLVLAESDQIELSDDSILRAGKSEVRSACFRW
jgi:hypothetical protein